MTNRSLFGLTLPELTAWLARHGQPAYRARQIFEAIYRQGIRDPLQISTIPSELRRRLAKAFPPQPLEAVQERRSEDETRKWLWRLADGGLIESVLIPVDSRRTLCVSTQVGCAYGCAFCASGLEGFQRNLSAGEIVQQVLNAEKALNSSGEGGVLGGVGNSPQQHHLLLPERGELRGEPGSGSPLRIGETTSQYGHGHKAVRHTTFASMGSRRLTNLVFMGMGEPLANYDNLLKAIRILNAPEGLAIGARRITISTVGLVPMIERLSKEGIQVELSISLHAPNDTLRGRLMPVNRKYPVKELLQACRAYVKATKRLITFEYILIDGVNDRPEEARELAALLKGLLAKVNLIPCHPIPGAPFGRPPQARMLAFEKALREKGIACTLRRSRGLDIEGACGQLRLHQREANKRLAEFGGTESSLDGIPRRRPS